MTALKIEQVPIDSLTPNPRNYRKHPSGQIGEIAHSLTEFGQFKNIVVSSDGIILAGEGVWTGAKRRGDETIAAFRTDFDADDPRAQKLMVADNALARLAEDDDAQLAQLLREVSEEMGLEGTGYDEEELAELLDDLELADVNLVPDETAENTQTRQVGLWKERENVVVTLGDFGTAFVPRRLTRQAGDILAAHYKQDPAGCIEALVEDIASGNLHLGS